MHTTKLNELITKIEDEIDSLSEGIQNSFVYTKSDMAKKIAFYLEDLRKIQKRDKKEKRRIRTQCFSLGQEKGFECGLASKEVCSSIRELHKPKKKLNINTPVIEV